MYFVCLMGPKYMLSSKIYTLLVLGFCYEFQQFVNLMRNEPVLTSHFLYLQLMGQPFSFSVCNIDLLYNPVLHNDTLMDVPLKKNGFLVYNVHCCVL